jgi:hypothetical protein
MTQGRFHAFDLSLAGARHRGAATLAALALGLSLAAGGCGGGGGTQLSKTQYESQIQREGQKIRNAFAPLSKPPTSLAALAGSIKAGQNKLREVADDLERTKPPDDVAKDNAALAASLRKLADQLDPLRQGAAKGDVTLVQKAVNTLRSSKSLRDAQKATADMREKGYDVGPLGG